MGVYQIDYIFKAFKLKLAFQMFLLSQMLMAFCFTNMKIIVDVALEFINNS